ncbi:MAG: aldehyde dehydrogenase family protein [Caulobacterales bacterium]|nr:aldehyde dehydrogenase family protein [Caulobacterales bacterium]
MPDATRFYIGGEWVAPCAADRRPIINPATEAPIGEVALGGPADVDRAVAAAKAAFPAFARTTVGERLELLTAINARLIERNEDLALAISQEMGAPMKLAQRAQAPSGTQHFAEIIKVLKDYRFEEPLGTTLLRHEPIGVAALITPWNWPMNQIATKVAPALAAGCTMVLKPSELAPLDAVILAEIMDAVGVPAGVFNLIHGDGPGVGAPLTAHPDVDMISFTGSTRAGVAISEAAAPSVKRVALELGGKSANIILDDADLDTAIPASVRGVMTNTGQSCNAPTRLLVPASRYEEVARRAVAAAEAVTVGLPDSGAHMGPIANEAQYWRVVAMIEQGLAEGAELLSGGVDRPDGQEAGYFVPPSVFGRVTRDMTIAREEIFGPVLSIMTYETVEDAIELANDTEYGLSGAVWSGDRERACEIAAQMRTGMVHINGASLDSAAPFGGFKKSGNGREWGRYGLEEFLEVKSVYGACAS